MAIVKINQKYLRKFLQTGDLSKEDLLDFYVGKGLKEKIDK